jgi:hypothetical protein
MTYYLKGSRSKERMHDRYPVVKEKVKLEIEASSCDVIVLDRKGMMQGKRRQLRFTKKRCSIKGAERALFHHMEYCKTSFVRPIIREAEPLRRRESYCALSEIAPATS